jgi:RES domain-containing protein
VRVWRITRAAYHATALLGIGARATSGRWHTAGTTIAYTGGSGEITMLEMLVHLDLEHLPSDYVELQFEVPDDAVEELRERPKGWDALPPYLPHVQAIGDGWVRSGRSLALKVPASVYPTGHNLLINPAHPRFGEIREIQATPYVFPQRLIRELKR